MIDTLLALTWFALGLFCCLCIHVRECIIRNLWARIDYLHLQLHDANRLVADKDERVGALLRENTQLLTELAYLKRDLADDGWDVDELIGEVEEWLA